MRRSYRRMLSDLFRRERSLEILDIGCGAGFAVHALIQDGFIHSRGIDATSSLVEIARKRGLPVDFVAEDRTEELLDSRQQSLDVAFLFEVLEHLDYSRQIRFLRSIRTALRPSGVFYCQVPNAMCIASSYLRYNDWTHRCLFTMSSLEFVLESAGFEVRGISGAPGRPSPVRRGPLRFLMPIARNVLQVGVDALWRVPVVASLGPLGFRHPLKPTLLAVCSPRA
jgi:SAM-dependent methyltransferase